MCTPACPPLTSYLESHQACRSLPNRAHVDHLPSRSLFCLVLQEDKIVLMMTLESDSGLLCCSRFHSASLSEKSLAGSHQIILSLQCQSQMLEKKAADILPPRERLSIHYSLNKLDQRARLRMPGRPCPVYLQPNHAKNLLVGRKVVLLVQ
jgi:hypothetical protein